MDKLEDSRLMVQETRICIDRLKVATGLNVEHADQSRRAIKSSQDLMREVGDFWWPGHLRLRQSGVVK